MRLAWKSRLVVLIAIFLLPGANTLRGAGPDAQWLGVLWTKGYVSVGNTRVSSGTTVLPGDVITTELDASAWVRFRSPASMILLAGTEVTLLAGNTAPSLALRRGRVVIDEKVADPVRVTVPGGFVLVKGDPQSGAECEMAAVGDTSTVSVRRGLAEIHSLGVPVTLHAGQSARVDVEPPNGPPAAGKSSREIPQEVIRQQGQSQEVPLNLNDIIHWNDQVRTLQSGRTYIDLLDGSTVHLASNSVIRILKHDLKTQQTEIDFTWGEVLVDVQKITVPGGIFKLYTKHAVVGRTDNSYVCWTDDKHTKVCDISGITEVKSSDPNILKAVQLTGKQCTDVPSGLAPTDPVLSPNEVSSLIQLTTIEGPAGPGALAGIYTAGGLIGGGIAAIVLTRPGATSPTTP